MAAVASQDNPLPLRPANPVPTMTSKGTDPADRFEQLLRQCENRAIPEAKAQEVVNRLDQWLGGKLDPSKKRYLVSLMKICKAYCFVPTSHLIRDGELEKLHDDENPLKDEESLDVWPGVYKGEVTVSIKVLAQYRSDGEKRIKRKFCREAVTWKRMSHPNILPLIGVTLSKELAVVSPWMENVLDYLKENHEANPVKLLEESVRGLQYLHEIGLVHGDLQGRHILVNDEGHACLANVGHASIVREGASMLGPVSSTAGPGDLRYHSPEMLTDTPATIHVTKQSDIYSMGMTIYEVLTDKKPFHEYSSWGVVLRIVEGDRPKKPNFVISRGYTEDLWELTTACWGGDPAKRPTASKLRELLGNAALQWKSRKCGPTGTDDTDDEFLPMADRDE